MDQSVGPLTRRCGRPVSQSVSRPIGRYQSVGTSLSIERSVDWLGRSVFGRLIDQAVGWPVGRSATVSGLIGRSIGWLIWSVVWLGWSVRWMVGRSVDQSVGWPVVGLSASRSVSGLVGCPMG